MLAIGARNCGHPQPQCLNSNNFDAFVGTPWNALPGFAPHGGQPGAIY
jgi:hypothetical protein